jgi:hypothetical protein
MTGQNAGQKTPSATLQNKPTPHIDRIAIRRARNAARAAALLASAQVRKGRESRPTLSVSLSTQQQEAIRREADRLFRELGRHPDCKQQEDGPCLLLTGKLTAGQILRDDRIKISYDTPISKIKIQDCLRSALLHSLRDRKRQELGKSAYQPKPEAKAEEKRPRTHKAKPKTDERPARVDSRKTRRLERQADEAMDVSGILEQVDELEAQQEWRRAAVMLLQTGDVRVRYLERIGENFMRAEAYRDLVGNLAPYCGYKGVSSAVPAMVGFGRLKLGQFDKASRVVEPILNDPAWGTVAREVAAAALMEQERPWMVLELLDKPTSPVQQQLRDAAQISAGLLSEDAEKVAQVLARIGPERLQRQAGIWRLDVVPNEDDETIPHQIKLAPASFAKAVTMADALLQINRPDFVVTQVFNAIKVPVPETAAQHQLHAQAHAIKARAHLAFSTLLPDPQPHVDIAFDACAVALFKRPTDKELLLLAAKITDASAEPSHKSRLAAVLEAARTVPADVKDEASAHEPVAEELGKAFTQQALAKVERAPHRPAPTSRRAGGFNFVR